MLGNLSTNLLWLVSFTVVIATCASMVAGTRLAFMAKRKGWLNEFTAPVAGMIGAAALVPIIATLALGGTPGVIALACGVIGAGIIAFAWDAGVFTSACTINGRGVHRGR